MSITIWHLLKSWASVQELSGYFVIGGRQTKPSPILQSHVEMGNTISSTSTLNNRRSLYIHNKEWKIITMMCHLHCSSPWTIVFYCAGLSNLCGINCLPEEYHVLCLYCIVLCHHVNVQKQFYFYPWQCCQAAETLYLCQISFLFLILGKHLYCHHQLAIQPVLLPTPEIITAQLLIDTT